MRESKQIKHTIWLIIINAVFATSVFQVCLADEGKEKQPDFTVTVYSAPEKKVPGSSYISMIPCDGMDNLLVYKDVLYGSSFNKGYVSFFNLKTLRHIKTVEMDESERLITYDPNDVQHTEIRRYAAGDLAVAGEKLFVGQIFSDYILAIDIETGEILYRIPVGGEGSLTASPDGNILYFASNLKNEFFIIDPYTYKYAPIPFSENCKGIGSLAISPDGRYLYLGIQRGEIQTDDQKLKISRPHLAVYDLSRQKYTTIIPFARVEETLTHDVAIPHCFLPENDGSLLYVGMFQSQTGIQIVDAKKLKITGYIPFKPNEHNEYFKWVDPLSLAFYKDYLLSFNRNNAELAVIDRNKHNILAVIDLGLDMTSSASVVVYEDTAYLAYPERKAILAINMKKLTNMISTFDSDSVD